MLCGVVERPRVLLICAHIVARARRQLDILGRRLHIGAHVDVIEASQLRLLARILNIAVRGRGYLAALDFCSRFTHVRQDF